MASSRLAAAAKIARELVEDPLYRLDLQRRLLEGKLASNIEVMLWQYAYGKPIDVVELKDERELGKMTDAELAAYELSLRVLTTPTTASIS
jgi:hypothetical protein